MKTNRIFRWMTAGAAALGLCSLAPSVQASSHREAPSIAEDPAADSTDLYAFLSPNNDPKRVPNSLTILANYWPLEEPGGGPNWPRFSDNVLYEIKIDNTGDAVEDITYQFRFKTVYTKPGSFLLAGGPVTTNSDNSLQVRQTYTVTRVVKGGTPEVLIKDQLTPPVFAGEFTMGNQAAYDALAAAAVYPLGGDRTTNGDVFAGQRDDPFFADLGSIFDLVRVRCTATPNANSCAGQAAANVKGVDFVGGYNVHTIALQIPVSKLLKTGATAGKDQVLGIWTSASRPRLTIRRSPTTAAALGGVKGQDNVGNWVQVSRLGIPLVNEVLVPLAFKDFFNTTQPANDAPLFTSPQGGPILTDPELAQALKLLYNVNIPAAGRTDLVELVTFGIRTSAAGAYVGPFMGPTYGLTPADILRVDVSVPPPADLTTNRLGAPGVLGGATDANFGFPNGRRLHDDVVDIEETVVSGVLRGAGTALGDGVDANDRPFLANFPYASTPWSGSRVNAKGGPYPQLHTATTP